MSLRYCEVSDTGDSNLFVVLSKEVTLSCLGSVQLRTFCATVLLLYVVADNRLVSYVLFNFPLIAEVEEYTAGPIPAGDIGDRPAANMVVCVSF